MSNDSMPTPPDYLPAPTHDVLVRFPELAVLALLQRVLEITHHALIAANPELHACLDEEPGGLPWDAQVKAASNLLDLAGQTHGALHHYRRLLAELDALEATYGFPF
ncbi:hypothetical protein KJ682_13875 [bacterium]|nr:hypothetical protein [bacterium]